MNWYQRTSSQLNLLSCNKIFNIQFWGRSNKIFNPRVTKYLFIKQGSIQLWSNKVFNYDAKKYSITE